MKTRIVYEDEQVIVCHKEAGVATQSGKIGQPDVVSELKNYLAKNGNKSGYLGVIHRLDQPVEGLLVFAKTPDAAAKLTAQLQDGMLNKKYYALCLGTPKQEKGQLTDYLLKEGTVAKITAGAGEGAKKAVLYYSLMKQKEVTKDMVISLFDITIETGRFHQIRVQMSHAGLPLLGDNKYGAEDALTCSKKLGIRNVALYAYHLMFTHPKTHKQMEFQITPEMALFTE